MLGYNEIIKLFGPSLSTFSLAAYAFTLNQQVPW